MVEAIAAAVPGQLRKVQIERARRKPTDSPTAYDYALRGEWLLRADWNDPEAFAMLGKAAEIDPQYAHAHARLGVIHYNRALSLGNAFDEASLTSQSYMGRALALDEDDSFVQRQAGTFYPLMGQHDPAKYHSERAIALNPNNVEAIIGHALLLAFLGYRKAGLDV
ncbi:MAG: hypothetical protein VYA71_09055 [Pseudomonadota bacterium]|nr:hypothetical protein [Pseudomonadota bacterium]